MHTFIYSYIYIHVHIYMFIYIHIYIYIYAYIYMCRYTYTYEWVKQHVSINHVAHINGSCHTIQHVTYQQNHIQRAYLHHTLQSCRTVFDLQVLQCLAVCCSVLQFVAVCSIMLQCVAVCCSVLHHVAACCSVLQRVAEWPANQIRPREHIFVVHSSHDARILSTLHLKKKLGLKNSPRGPFFILITCHDSVKSEPWLIEMCVSDIYTHMYTRILSALHLEYKLRLNKGPRRPFIYIYINIYV